MPASPLPPVIPLPTNHVEPVVDRDEPSTPLNSAPSSPVIPLSTNHAEPVVDRDEPNVSPEFAPYVCRRYLKEYIMQGSNDNNPAEVRKLQEFLNNQE